MISKKGVTVLRLPYWRLCAAVGLFPNETGSLRVIACAMRQLAIS